MNFVHGINQMDNRDENKEYNIQAMFISLVREETGLMIKIKIAHVVLIHKNYDHASKCAENLNKMHSHKSLKTDILNADCIT